jgi:phosphate butyryltransferase
MSKQMGLIEAVLFGESHKIISILKKFNQLPSDYTIVNTQDDSQSAKLAVSWVSEKKADFLIKGILQTGLLLSTALDKEIGLRTSNILSHIMIYFVPDYGKFLFLTDGGINTAPNIEQKLQIIDNVLSITKKFGINNPKIQATVDAYEISSMKSYWEEKNVSIEGPVGLDLAISKEACSHKNYSSAINGYTDILVVPTYEVGNGIGKTLTYFVKNVRQAGVVVGAKCPIVLVSRSDSSDSKMLSIALANMMSSI